MDQLTERKANDPREDLGGRVLTSAAQALLPNTHQHDVAEVTVSGLLEMLQGPGVPPVPLGALWR